MKRDQLWIALPGVNEAMQGWTSLIEMMEGRKRQVAPWKLG